VTPDDLVLTRFGVRFKGRLFPATIGRHGITRHKREGDCATPSGIHTVIGMMFRPDRIAASRLPGWAVPIGPQDLWCDAPDHPDYNRLVHAPFHASHERMHRADPLYDLVLLTDWNVGPSLPHKGSAIFLHQMRRPGYPTAGCVAFSRPHLLWIARRLHLGAKLIVRP